MRRSQRNWVKAKMNLYHHWSLCQYTCIQRKKGNRTAGGSPSPHRAGGSPVCLHVSRPLSPVVAGVGFPSRGSPRSALTVRREWCKTIVTTKPWLILPVAVCLFQRLSHANLRANDSNSRSVNGSLNQRLSTQFCGACPVTRIPILTVSLIRV